MKMIQVQCLFCLFRHISFPLQISAQNRKIFRNKKMTIDKTMMSPAVSRPMLLGEISLFWGAGLALNLKKKVSLQANYNVELGRGNYTSHFLRAGVRWEF